jgi:hypothetical protein
VRRIGGKSMIDVEGSNELSCKGPAANKIKCGNYIVEIDWFN